MKRNDNRGYDFRENTIVLRREFTELDLFVRDFLDVLKKYSDYLIVSGFVSVSTGRVRGTEDIDMLVPLMERKGFEKFFKDITENGFWCYQGDSAEEVFPYIRNMDNIRFARKGEMYPNVEFVPIDRSKKAQFFEFTHPQKIRVKNFEFKIPPLEFEILYKEIVLGGEKDLEDARHLRTLFSEILKDEKFKEYRKIVKGQVM